MDLPTRPVMVAKTNTLRAPGSVLRTAALAGGATLIVGGLASAFDWMLVPGGILMGWALQPDADRFYLEGFGDGLDAGTKLMADAADEAERVERRREGVRGDVAGAAAGPSRLDQWSAGAVTPIPGVGSPVGAGGGDRPARPAVTEDGRAIPVSGPRPSILPDLPAVVAGGTRSLDLSPKGRAEDGGPDGDGIGKDRNGKAKG